MESPRDSLEDRAARYATTRGTRLKRQLGHGKDGVVYSTEYGTAVKVFVREDAYRREVACYRRLLERGVFSVLDHSVPQLIQSDSYLLIIEMDFVEPPFILDFASAYLDYPPDFPPEVLEERENERLDLFGANWPKVKILLQIMEDQYELFLMDVHPGNITFAE